MFLDECRLAALTGDLSASLRSIGTPVAFLDRLRCRWAVLVLLGGVPTMAVASAIWYGAIAWIGFRFGENLEQMQALIGTATRTSGLVAVGIVIVAGVIIWWRRRRVR